MFNYVSYCKSLPVYDINTNIKRFIKKQQSNSNQNLNDNTVIVLQEISKFLMSQITSLRTLEVSTLSRQNVFVSYYGARDSLKYIFQDYIVIQIFVLNFFISYLKYVTIYYN